MIQRLEPFESHRTLGVHLNPMVTHDTQLLELLKKAPQFSAAAAHKSLDRVYAYIMYKILCTPVIHYPLPVSKIPNKELKSMQKNLLKTFKRKMKFRSNLTDSIVFGPRRWCGISLRESCFEQGLGNFKILVGHLRENKSAASAINAYLSTLQLEMGLVTPILSSEYNTYYLLCLEGWLKMTWKFLADSNITAKGKFWTPNLLHESDTSLMRHMAQHREEFTQAQVLAIN
jgi:hypothetical protein